jgi:hypothetical protein
MNIFNRCGYHFCSKEPVVIVRMPLFFGHIFVDVPRCKKHYEQFKDKIEEKRYVVLDIEY